MSGSKSTTLSDKVEASLGDAMANFKLLKKEMGAEFRRKNAQLESEKQLLEAGKKELEAAKLELEADRAEFEAIRGSDSFPDPKLEIEKAALKLEKMQLEAEKIKLKTAQTRLGKDRAVLESREAQLRIGQFKLKAAQSQLDDAKTQLESGRVSDDKVAELEIKVLQLESEKSKGLTQISLLEDDKLSLKSELSQSKAEVKSLIKKVKEVEKQLDQCRKDKPAMPDVEIKASLQWEKIKELEKQLGKCCDAKKTLQTEIAGFREKRNPRVFLDVAISGRAARRIVIELDVKTTPKTCENFRALCTGEKGIGKSGKLLHYKGTKFNYIDVTNNYCMVDVNLNKNGVAGEYGCPFPPENFIKKHTGPGVVSMAATIDSQSRGSAFFITTAKFERTACKTVAFGDVVEGMDVVMDIMKSGKGASVIVDCGQLY